MQNSFGQNVTADNRYSSYSVVEPKPSFIKYGTLPSAFLLVGTWRRLWQREWSEYNSAPPSSVRSLRGNYIPVIFLYCGLTNSFCDIPFFFFWYLY